VTADPPELIVTDAPSAEDQAVVHQGLADYNFEQAGYRDSRPLAVFVCDPATGRVQGGLTGSTSMGLLRIDRFFLPAALRRNRLGSRVLRAAEAEAVKRGCTQAVLWTVHFQAPEFYKKVGWRELGRIEFAPPGHTRFCMTKTLAIG
jgi:GNAT superfamily N-acetyltransferase